MSASNWQRRGLSGRSIGFLMLLGVMAVGWMMVEAIRNSPTRGQAAIPVIVSEPGFPMRIEMSWGATIEIPTPPQRIIPANAGVVDMITELVDPSRVAALPITADDWSRIGTNPEGYEQHARYPEFKAENVLAHEPDLIVTSPFNAPDTIRSIEEAGIPVLKMPDTFDLDTVIEALTLLGKLLDVEARATELIADLRRRERALLERHEGKPALRAVAYANYGFGGTGQGANTTQNEVFRLAGLRNALAEAGHVGVVKLNYEDLLALDPDLLIVSFREDNGIGVTGDLLEAEPALAELRAVKENRMLELPARHFFTVSQELLYGGEALADELDRWLAAREPAAGAGAAAKAGADAKVGSGAAAQSEVDR